MSSTAETTLTIDCAVARPCSPLFLCRSTFRSQPSTTPHLLAIVVISPWIAAFAQAPSRFSAAISNFTDHTYTVELRDGALLYSDAFGESASAPRPTRITPTAEQWHVFRRALDSINIWQW